MIGILGSLMPGLRSPRGFERKGVVVIVLTESWAAVR